MKRQNKYKNLVTYIGDERFDSKREAARYWELLLLQKAGHLSGLDRQVRFKMQVAGVHIATYIPDFTYSEGEKLVAEDVKGVETPVFKLKAKLFRALWPEWELRIVK